MSVPPPLASVILPAYHSDAWIGTCLEALRAQTFRDFEAIVVNSSPEDRTRHLVTTRFPEVVFEQSPRRLLPHAARNRGVALARGRMLVFTDPDCIPAPDWLERLLAASEDGTKVVQGSMALHGTGWLDRGVHLCKWFALLPGLPSRPLGQIATGNSCYPRSVWDAAGPFDGDLFCGDAVLSWRAAALGHPLWFEPRAVVEQIHGQSLRSLGCERLRRGEEFAQARARYENWRRGQAAMRALSSPLATALVVFQAARAARRSGWLSSYLGTLPVQLVGQVAWSLGEATACMRRALGI